jgi:hypothetical protein
MCPKGHYRYSYRGLSPHRFMPMSGVHNRFEADGLSLRCVHTASLGSSGTLAVT